MSSPAPSPIRGPLSEAEVQDFYERGFFVRRGVFDRATVDVMAAAFDELVALAGELERSGICRGAQFVLGERPDGDGRGAQIQRVVWCGAAAPALSQLGMDRRLVAPAAQLLGVGRVQQLINQAHFKLPGDGVAFPWHQDSRHRRYGTPVWRDVDGRGSFVETVTAIDAMRADNGPLAFIPGSAGLGHLPTDPISHELPAGSFDPAQAVELRLDPGDVAFFGPYAIHGSAPNRSRRPRRAFLNGFAQPDANTRVYPGEGAGRYVFASETTLGARG